MSLSISLCVCIFLSVGFHVISVSAVWDLLKVSAFLFTLTFDFNAVQVQWWAASLPWMTLTLKGGQIFANEVKRVCVCMKAFFYKLLRNIWFWPFVVVVALFFMSYIFMFSIFFLLLICCYFFIMLFCQVLHTFLVLPLSFVGTLCWVASVLW